MINYMRIINRFLYILYIFFKFKLFLLFITKESFIFKIFTFEPQNVKTALEKLGPIFIKFGQIISNRHDIFNKDIIYKLENLQNKTTFVNFKYIKNIIETSLDIKINLIFKKINENPLSSASIAQIHCGLLKNGDKVIIKILKPAIRETIYYDLFLLEILLICLSLFSKNARFKLLDILIEIKNIFKKELNFKHEAAFISKFKENFNNSSDFYAPNIYWNLVSDDILVMEYIDGINILNLKKFKQENILIPNVIYNLFYSFYLQFLKYNFFHADLHPGNILISKNNLSNIVLVFFDFGIVSYINDDQKFYLIENILSFIRKDYKTIIKLHLQAHTIDRDIDIHELECDLRFIFDPILDKNLKDICFKKIINGLIMISHKINMRIQPKMLLFQKNLILIEGISRNLDANINIWEINRQIIENIFITDIMLNKILNKIKQKNIINKKKITFKKINLLDYIIDTIYENVYFFLFYPLFLLSFLFLLDYYQYLFILM